MPASYKLGSVLAVLITLNACSVVSAVQQPDEKNMTLLNTGTKRDLLVAEFGKPVLMAENENREKYDVFSFVDGYSTPIKTSRAVFHSLADIGTFGLWELAGGPLERHYNGTELLVQVTYDATDSVARVTELKRK